MSIRHLADFKLDFMGILPGDYGEWNGTEKKLSSQNFSILASSYTYLFCKNSLFHCINPGYLY